MLMAPGTVVVSVSVLVCWFGWLCDTKFDMGCKCGYRDIDPRAEKDCDESAKLEAPEQDVKKDK